MSAFGIFFLTYGIISIIHIVLQLSLGHLEYRKQKKPAFKEKYIGHSESVTVVVPVYNETAKSLDQCINSIYNQDYKDLHIVIVDDGSRNFDAVKKQVYAKYNHGRVELVRLEKNKGKRHAQKVGFDKAKGDIIVTVDSDTILHTPKAISHIVKRFKDSEVGAVTGHVKVENRKKNLLTRLISYRYWMAFNQERAAQSYFNVLMCCSGPYSAYRKTIIDKVKDKYLSQRFLGKPCSFGDDRHLTNLVLEEGHDVVYDNKAVAYTHVPENIREYLLQQVRWNKSFYREMLWTLKSIRKHHYYLVYDLLMQFILPFMLMFALGFTFYKTFTGHPGFLYFYLITVIGIAIFRALYGLIRTKDVGFLLFTIYGFVHIFLLLPTRIYALLTLRKTKWGTR